MPSYNPQCDYCDNCNQHGHTAEECTAAHPYDEKGGESIKAAREEALQKARDYCYNRMLTETHAIQKACVSIGFDVAQKVADEQTADLRNRLEAAESLIKSLTYFQVGRYRR